MEGEPACGGLSWGARITQERPPASFPGASGDLEKNQREKKEVARPKMVKKANTELL